MKHLLIIFFLSLCITSCGKKTTVTGRVYNPVTGSGIAGIDIVVTKPKNSLGYDGAGSKLVFKTTTDANGNFVIEDRFRKSKTYKLTYVMDLKKYALIEGESESIDVNSNQKELLYPLIPYGFLKYKIQNVNCFDGNDNFVFSEFYRLSNQKYDLYDSYYSGCYEYEFKGSVDGSPIGYVFSKMGWHVIEGNITRNGITTIFKDSIYVPNSDYVTWNIEY